MTPSPYADHDHISTKVLSGQREQVRGDMKTVIPGQGRNDVLKGKCPVKRGMTKEGA